VRTTAKTMTLVAKHLYFGLEPIQLRDAANRVLSRIPDTVTTDATVRLDALVEDFRISAASSRELVDKMVEDGILMRLPETGTRYAITTRFRELARARIIDPLERSRAQMLLTRCKDIAARFNRTALRNKYEIEAIAVYGSYMSVRPDLSELALGITGRRRAPEQRSLIGRATTPTEGTDALRELFERQSTFIEVTFFKRLDLVPRPFSVIFTAEV
jgi:hypothetical protein